MSVWEPGDAVEWRSGRWIRSGTYLGPDGGPHIGESDFARVDIDGEEWLVRPEILRKPGELAAEDAELADLIERAKGYPIGDDEHATAAREQRFPWCDTCKRPSVWGEFQGARHSTAEHPGGVPTRLDDSGHEVTHREWWTVPR